MLLSFHNNKEIKEELLVSTYEWLGMKLNPKSPEEIANGIFSTTREYVPSDCVLENVEDFPSKLGLPFWLGDLLFTINHFNSKDFRGFGKNYEEDFYPSFIKACNVGVDYTLLFHKWEIMLLSKMLPSLDVISDYNNRAISLHTSALRGEKQNRKEWIKLQDEIGAYFQDIDKFTGESNEVGLKELGLFENLANVKNTIDSMGLQIEATNFRRIRESYVKIRRNAARTIFLSIENYLNETPYTTSSEALIETLFEENVINNARFDGDSATEFREKIWNELMQKLLLMIAAWK